MKNTLDGMIPMYSNHSWVTWHAQTHYNTLTTYHLPTHTAFSVAYHRHI